MKKLITILVLTVFFVTAGCVPFILPVSVADAFFVIKPVKPVPAPKPIQPVKPVGPFNPMPLQPVK